MPILSYFPYFYVILEVIVSCLKEISKIILFQLEIELIANIKQLGYLTVIKEERGQI